MTQINPNHPEATQAQAWMTAYQAGARWATDLKIGDEFRGSYGEAAHRGLTGEERSMFGAGAASVMRKPTFSVWVRNDDFVITDIHH